MNETLKKDKLLTIKPFFNLLYQLFKNIGILAGALLILLLMAFIAFQAGDYPKTIFMIFGYFILFFIYIAGSLIFIKVKYIYITYQFDNDKVIYTNNFINYVTKEVKYKNIKEVVMRQSFMQRMFNLGDIIISTSAENGYNGMVLKDINDINNTYNEIKKLTNNEEL